MYEKSQLKIDTKEMSKRFEICEMPDPLKV
jgi:hypothetical protein